MTRPDLEAIRQRVDVVRNWIENNLVTEPLDALYSDVPALLAYIEELEAELARVPRVPRQIVGYRKDERGRYTVPVYAPLESSEAR